MLIDIENYLLPLHCQLLEIGPINGIGVDPTSESAIGGVESLHGHFVVVFV